MTQSPHVGKSVDARVLVGLVANASTYFHFKARQLAAYPGADTLVQSCDHETVSRTYGGLVWHRRRSCPAIRSLPPPLDHIPFPDHRFTFHLSTARPTRTSPAALPEWPRRFIQRHPRYNSRRRGNIISEPVWKVSRSVDGKRRVQPNAARDFLRRHYGDEYESTQPSSTGLETSICYPGLAVRSSQSGICAE
jgi:hypothetical protein